MVAVWPAGWKPKAQAPRTLLSLHEEAAACSRAPPAPRYTHPSSTPACAAGVPRQGCPWRRKAGSMQGSPEAQGSSQPGSNWPVGEEKATGSGRAAGSRWFVLEQPSEMQGPVGSAVTQGPWMAVQGNSAGAPHEHSHCSTSQCPQHTHTVYLRASDTRKHLLCAAERHVSSDAAPP